jgi:hypothetical protein
LRTTKRVCEARLWHDALHGVDQQQRCVHHSEHPLHFTAEVGVAGGVDQLDSNALEFDRRGLGEDGDAALALDVAGVERAVRDALVRAHGAGVAQEPVDQRGLAVVDVGDDRQVAQGLSGAGRGHGAPRLAERERARRQRTGLPPDNAIRRSTSFTPR